MRSFLLKEKTPICKWGSLPENTHFQGKTPEGFQLAVNPHGNYIIVDVDRHGDVNGFENIDYSIIEELQESFHYKTKNNGQHFWIMYTGDKKLANKTSGLGFDLRTEKGYVVWYPEIRVKDCLHLISESSLKLNKWLEKHFSYVN